MLYVSAPHRDEHRCQVSRHLGVADCVDALNVQGIPAGLGEGERTLHLRHTGMRNRHGCMRNQQGCMRNRYGCMRTACGAVVQPG